ncbi:hypothetical protein PAQ31011_01486 [Pandoraea aquatica]|uniref:Uncharacterized protein n=1 Tax=Pandoraea aquatica TaxID=2508290 RepID=A0A5E4TQ15_9BURK|nr:hypothetical protein [Pandoraea aquatica]VVD88199.1 hypothetical protein PAQ31011_01486 [Pandoraea aquatica]
MSLGFRDHVVLVERDVVYAASRAVSLPGRNVEVWRTRIDAGGAEGCAQLFDKLPRGRLSRFDRLHVLAGFGIAHYRVVHWPEGASSLADLRALAAAAFIERFGDAARRWTISMTPGVFGSPHIAVAVDSDWLMAMKALAEQARMRWVSCRGVLHEVARRTLDANTANVTIAVRHPHGLSCLLRRDGRWQDACALSSTGSTVSHTLTSVPSLCGASPAPVRMFDASGGEARCDDATSPAASPHPWLWETA